MIQHYLLLDILDQCLASTCLLVRAVVMESLRILMTVRICGLLSVEYTFSNFIRTRHGRRRQRTLTVAGVVGLQLFMIPDVKFSSDSFSKVGCRRRIRSEGGGDHAAPPPSVRTPNIQQITTGEKRNRS